MANRLFIAENYIKNGSLFRVMKENSSALLEMIKQLGLLEMKVVLEKKPSKVDAIVAGFPGVGLVGTIVTKFLLDKLEFDKIGFIESEKLIPVMAIHKCKLVEPLGIFYNKKHNLVVVQTLSGLVGVEWEIAKAVVDLAKQLDAKEIISIDSMMAETEELKGYYYTNDNKRAKQFEGMKVECLKEGIVMGVNGALLLKSKLPTSCIFMQTHHNLPDSEAAAHTVEILDKLLGLKVDFKPLLEAAKKFEKQLKIMIEKSQEAQRPSKADLSYVG